MYLELNQPPFETHYQEVSKVLYLKYFRDSSSKTESKLKYKLTGFKTTFISRLFHNKMKKAKRNYVSTK